MKHQPSMNAQRRPSDSPDMSRYMNRGAQILIDLTALSAAYWLAFFIRFELTMSLYTAKLLFFTWPYVLMLQYLALVLFEVPRFSWRYVGLAEAKRIFVALLAASTLLVVLRLGAAPIGGYAKFVSIPLGVLIMDFMLSVMGVAGVRILRRIQSESRERAARGKQSVLRPKRTLLLGAGRAGVMVAREVSQNPHVGLEIVGFADDDPHKVGTIIQGHKVLGDTASLERLAAEHQVEMAIITIAAAPGASIRRIHAECERIGLSVKIIPGIYEILEGTVALSRLREVTIEDLLGRDAVQLDMEAIGSFLRGKRVLVTGAGGSIGSELCRQVARFAPAKLILAEQAENSLFYIHKELVETEPGFELVPCIVDICDTKRVDQLFGRLSPQVVFHAAAHKHVPMMEWNPGEAIKNNVFGTKKVADAADRHGAEAFVMISTDKAVNPTSIMGTSKRVAEIYVQALSRRSKTKFVAVRFGNVLGSAGSVIPIFKEQIRQGGPVKVTHPDMTRYFMTIPEATQLVMQAATMGDGGEIFVLDMGRPVKIVDLARDLIRLSGFAEDEIRVEFSGVRPGEKLYEEISTKAENMDKTRHPKIFIGRIAPYTEERIRDSLLLLEGITDASDPADVRQALKQVVPEMLTPEPETRVREVRPPTGDFALPVAVELPN